MMGVRLECRSQQISELTSRPLGVVDHILEFEF